MTTDVESNSTSRCDHVTSEVRDPETSATDFKSFDLDARLTRVLQKQNIQMPTLVQSQVIPLAFLGKDVLARAPTGSGKTLAYLLPILNSLIGLQTDDVFSTLSQGKVISALILLPKIELAKQVFDCIQSLLHYFPKNIDCVNLCAEQSMQMQRVLLRSAPSIVVSTPSRILGHLESDDGAGTTESMGGISLGDLQFLVLDEADMILSFGYESDLERLSSVFIPKTVQTFLMSATLSDDVDRLSRLVLRNPVSVNSTLPSADSGIQSDTPKVRQFLLRCEREDKFLVMYVVLKLRLLQGKLLIFANQVDTCVRLKLFLDQFAIKSCILNAELPIASRHHIVDEFNRGVFDILIASDLSDVYHQRRSIESAGHGEASAENQVTADSGKKRQKLSRMEGGVARGVDFKRVDVVINFDVPERVDSYVHRIGRTARGGRQGAAITLVSSSSDEQMISLIIKDQEDHRHAQIQNHEFDLKQLEGFRYRCADALRAVTKSAVKKARLQSIRQEICRSERLKSFFAERPKDLALLRHENVTKGIVKAPEHLRNVPKYLLPVKHGASSITPTGTTSSMTARTLEEHEALRNSFEESDKSNPLKSSITDADLCSQQTAGNSTSLTSKRRKHSQRLLKNIRRRHH